MLAMSQSGILTDDFSLTDFKPTSNEPPRRRFPGEVLLPKRVVRIPLPALTGQKRSAPALTSDSLLEDAHKRIKLRLNNNEAQVSGPPRLHLRRTDLSLLEPILQSVLSGTFSKSKVFNLQVISPINLSASSASKVRVSDGRNVTDNCIMIRQNNVKLLQNPVIKVIGWDIISHQDNICLHITDFVTVKNTVDFAVIGKPVLLNNVPQKKEEKTTFENTELDGVLIPGSNVKSMVVRIMDKMRSHYVNDFGNFPSRAYSRPDRQIWTKT